MRYSDDAHVFCNKKKAHWTTNSEVVMAVADEPTGPYVPSLRSFAPFPCFAPLLRSFALLLLLRSFALLLLLRSFSSFLLLSSFLHSDLLAVLQRFAVHTIYKHAYIRTYILYIGWHAGTIIER